MPSTQQVSFTSPGFDYGADLSSIERKRKLAEALQAQVFEPTQTATSNGLPTPMSWTQGAAKLAQAWAAGRQGQRADEEQRALSAKAQQDLSDVLSKANSAYTGTPAIPQPSAELGGGPGAPAQGPDAMKAANVYMTHPMTAGIGTQLMGQELSRQRLLQALTPQQGNPMAPGPGASVMAGSGSSTPTAPAQSGAAVGGPAGGVPMAAWLAADPSGAKYMEQLAKDYAETQKPVVDRGFGIKTKNPLTGKYDLASNPDDITTIERAKLAATQPYEAPVTLKTSSGQDIQLSRPEYAEYQKSGQLPARYGQAAPQAPAQPQAAEPLPASVPPEHAAAYRTVLDASRRGVTASAQVPAQGLGTVGATQSQADQIRQVRQQAGGKAVDEAFAKDYVAFTTGGAQDAAKQLAQLKDVTTALAEPKANLTGPFLGRVPDSVKSFTNPQSIAMRERVEEVVQRSLRAILGAQFTEKEGERLIARAYNPNLGEKENAIRVGRLFTQLEQGFAAKQDAAQYFEKNGTLDGWTGKLPALADFDPDKSGNLVKDVVNSGVQDKPKNVKWGDLKRQ